ncbi:hypothetical protein ABPG72_016280 [Tetrahymena utriculariae]
MVRRILLFLSLLYNHLVDSQTSSSQIQPILTKNLNTEYNSQTYYQFSFNYTGQVVYDRNARIVVTFPAQITLNLFPAYLDCEFQVKTTFQTVKCDYNNNGEVIVYVGNLSQGTNNLAIGSIKNPNGITGTSFFKLCTYYNDVPTNCNQNFGQVFFDRSPASMVSGNVQYKSSLIVGQGSSWIFNFSLKGLIYDAGLYSIRITFPNGFTTQQTICEVEGNPTQSKSIILYSQNIIECQNINKQMSGTQEVRIINMINPLSAIQLTNFKVELLQQSSGIILERINITPKPSINLISGSMYASLQQSDQYSLSNSTYTFYLNPLTLLGDGGSLTLKFPSSYTLWALNCTLIKGLQRYSGSNPSCYLDLKNNQYVVNNFSDVSPDTQVIINVVLQTPPSQGSYPISVQTLNSQGQIVDQAQLNGVTNSTYGSAAQFTAHALINAVKLKAGQSGPLESTFFLKHNLPATNYKSVGKVVINIFPKIPAPSINYGIIKCYFYGNILASNCKYDDTTYADRTQITIYTPEDFNYQNSEIPITVTTEGAKPGYTDGIPLDPLVQRYLFHYYFYNSDAAGAVPVEVYFQEWISDPFEIPDSAFQFTAIIQESNEYTHLNFKAQQQLTFIQGQRNYLVRVTFQSLTNAWAIGQPYQNNYEVIQGFPCYLQGTAVTANPIAQCDLYQQNFADPFIQAYGFQTLQVAQGQWFNFDIPAIQIANVPAGTIANLRFSIMEETPGMYENVVELYYKSVSFIIQPQSFINYSFNPNIATTLVPPFVDQITNLRFQWSAAVLNPDYLIYEIDQTAFYDIGTQLVPAANCDGNTCITFKKNVQYFVVYPNTPLTQQIITNINQIIRNPNYSGSFVFKVRAMKAGKVVNKHTFNVNIASATIISKIFDVVPSANVQNNINTVIRQNEEHEFYIKFTTITEMPRDSLIKFTFYNIQTQVQQYKRHFNYCKIISGLQPYDQTPIQCTVPNTQVFQVTHFDYVPAGTQIEIHFRLLNQGGPALNPSVDIETYYGPSNTNLIDSTYAIPDNTPNISTNNQDSQVEFKVLDQPVRQEKREKSYVGPVIINFATNNLQTLKYIKVTFDNNFSTPRSYGVDSLICLINEVRFFCSYTINPMIVIIDMSSNTISLLAQNNRLSISTEYVSPLDGILHPSVEGFYPIHIEMSDQNGVLNQATKWMFIKAPKFQFIYIQSVIRNQNRANMFYVNFKTTQPVPAYNQGGRIQIEFPTVDPMGNPMFGLSLGGYQNTGDNVGCRFVQVGTGDVGLINTWRCRLIKAQSLGNPAIVEIINFGALSAFTEVQMWIAKVFNPPNFNYPAQPTLQVMDANIAVNIYQQDTQTGVLKYIHYDYYNVFMDIRDDPTLHNCVHPFSSQANNQVWETGSMVNKQQKAMVNQVFYDITPFAPGDYYIVELLQNPLLQPDWKMSTCSTFYDWCLTFPQINWVVMHVNTNLAANTMYASNDVFIQLLPQSVPQVTTTYNSYVWQNRFFVGYVTHQITPQQWLQLIGQITNAQLIQLDSPMKLVKSRTRVEVNFNFTVQNFIPSTGAIQIRFPSRIPSIQSHCRSSITVGSGLQQASGNYGNVGCLVQDTNTWVIYGFQNVNPLTNIKISGIIYLPTDGNAGYIGNLDVITYGTHEYQNIFNVGQLIDKSLSIPNSGFSINNFQTKQIEDVDLLHIETQALRVSATSPLNFKFQVGQNIFANQGRIRLMSYQFSQLSFNDNRGNPFQYQPTSQYVCNIQVVLTGENYGCKMESIQLINNGSNQIYYQFQMIPNSDLASTVDYLFLLTTINGNGQDEGLVFPNSGLPYKIDVSMAPNQPQSDSDYTLHEHLYYQVYGSPFVYLKFTSYITLQTEMNLFIVTFQANQIIRHDDTLVIEMPTTSIDLQYNLFADDGGLNLNNQDIVPVDIINMSVTYPNPTIKCRLSRGLQLKGIPLKFLCSKFMSNGVLTNLNPNDQMSLAFNIMNPSVPANHYSIPATVYIRRNYQNANEILFWDLVENAFYIHFWNPQVITGVNGDFNLGPVTSTVCGTNTDFKFRVQNSQNLIYNNDDAYILRFSFETIDPQYLHIKNCAYVLTGSPANSCAILPNLKSMIVWPNPTNFMQAPMQVTTLGQVWYTTPYRDQDPQHRVIVGYACYVRNLWSEKIIYQDNYPDIQPQRISTVNLDIKFKGEAQYHHSNQQQDFQFFVTAPFWYNVDIVAIVFPANNGWQLIQNQKNMCNEGPLSQIQINNCYFDSSTGNIIVWIYVAFQNTYVSSGISNTQTLVVESHMEAFYVSSTASLYLAYNTFGVEFYSWSRSPDAQTAPWFRNPPVALNPSTEQYACFSGTGTNPGVFPDNPINWDNTWQNEQNIKFDYEYHRYNDEFVPCFTTQRAPIRMDVIVPVAFASLYGSTNFHIFDFFYGTDVVIPTPIEYQDYVQDKLICYVNNDRVKCTNDSVNNKIRLYFQTQIAANGILFVYITAYNTNDITQDGFSYNNNHNTGQYQWLYEITSFGSGQTYYGYTTPFPIFFNTNGGIVCPFRGIEAGGPADQSTQIPYLPVAIWWWLRFARPDIIGLTFNFVLLDEDKRQLPMAGITFWNLDSGSSYPCSRGIAGGQRNPVRCIIENGDPTGWSTPVRIHVFDFNYQMGNNEVFGFLFGGLSNLLEFTVEAWGGSATFNQPYGNQFMGSLLFHQWWGPSAYYCYGSCGPPTCANNQSNCNFISNANMFPSRPAYMSGNQLTFQNSCITGTQNTVLLEVVIQKKPVWDTSYEELCTVDFQYNVKDMFIYEQYTWQGNPALNSYVKKYYLYYDFSNGQQQQYTVGYFKCKHYREPIIARTTCSDVNYAPTKWQDRYETTTHYICEAATGSASCNGASGQTNELVAMQNTVDITQYNNDWDYKIWHHNTQNWLVLAVKLSDIMNNSLIGGTTYAAVLTITFDGAYTQSTGQRPYSCYVIEGLRMSDPRFLGSEPQCSVVSDPNNAGIENYMFMITNWDTIVQQEYVRILFNMQVQVVIYAVPIVQYIPSSYGSWINTYANMEAYNTGQNGHMNSRDNPTLYTQWMCDTYMQKMTVNSFNWVGANTVINFDVLVPPMNCGYFHYDDGYNCDYTQAIQLSMFGLQDLFVGTATSVQWARNGNVDPLCQGFGLSQSKGYLIWTFTFSITFHACMPTNPAGETWNFQITFINSQIRLDRNFWWVHMRAYETDTNYHGWPWVDSCAWHWGCEMFCVDDEYVETKFQIGNNLSVTQLSSTLNSITEVDFTITGLFEAVGLDVGVNRILIMIFKGPDWIDNPIYNTQYTLQQIDCLCQVNGGPFQQSTCVRRIRQTVAGRVYDPVVLFYFSAPTGSTVRCSVPEIIIGTTNAQTRYLSFKIIRPSIYEWYGKNGEQFNSRIKTDYPFAITGNAFTTDLNIFYDPSVFYIGSQTTQLFVGYYDLQVQNIKNLNQPYLYFRHADIGPLMTAELCSDAGLWNSGYNKFYNLHSKVLICQRISSATTNAVIGAGKNLYFEQWKSQTTSDYFYYVYAYQNGQLMQQQQSAPIPNANFQPINSNGFQVLHFFYYDQYPQDNGIFAIQVGLRGFLWRETRDGGRLEVWLPRSQVTGITQSCTARVEKQFQYVLWCYVDNRDPNNWILVVNNLFTQFQTPNFIDIYFFMTNPTGAANRVINYTVKFYYNYQSDSDFKIQLQDTYTQTDFNFDEYDAGKIRIPPSMSYFYGFRVKQFMQDFYELRYYVKFLTQKVYYQISQIYNFDGCAMPGYDCNGNLDVRVREHDTVILGRYREIEDRSTGFFGTGFQISQFSYRPWNQNAFLEIIISQRNYNSHIGLWKQNSAYQYDMIRAIDSAQSPLTIKYDDQQQWTRYIDKSTNVQTDAIYLKYFYFTNQIHQQPTSFQIAILFKYGCNVDYPRAYFELKFPVMAVANIPGAVQGGLIPCQISLVLEQNPNRINSARCKVFDIDTSSYKGLMVRIEEINQFAAGSLLTFAFDDWVLPTSTNLYTAMDIEFNFFMGWPGSQTLEYNRYYLLLKEMILIDGVNSQIWNNANIGAQQLNPPNSYQYGQQNVEYDNNVINNWPQTTTGYNPIWNTVASPNTAGQKMRLIYYHGFVGGNNYPDTLTYFDTTGQLTLLWFNRHTNSAYITAPKFQAATSSVTISIKNAVNPYPYQQNTWNSDGRINYQLYMGQYWNFDGDGFRQTNIGEIDLSSNAQWSQYIRTASQISIDINNSNLIDVVPTYSYASGQSITMRFTIKNSMSNADMLKQQISYLQFSFTQGVKLIRKCYIQSQGQNSNVFIDRYAECVIGYNGNNYILTWYKIAYWDTTKPYLMFVEMITNSATIVYTVSTVVSNGNAAFYNSYTVPFAQFSSSHFSFAYYRFTEGKYIPNYYELQNRQLYSNQAVLTTWRLRFRFVLDVTLNYVQTNTYIDPITNADYLQINFPPQQVNAYIQTDPTQWLMCYFVPEISIYDKIALPFYSKCQLNTSGSPYYYVLTAPRDILQKGVPYVVHIRERRIQGGSFNLPNTPTRSEFIWQCYSPISTTTPSYDTFITKITNRFLKAKINHLTTTSQDYDVAEITFTPSFPLSQSTETYLQVEIDSIYLQAPGQNFEDFDLRNTYNRDGLGEFINGQSFSYLMYPVFPTGYAIVNFGQHSNFFANIRIMLVQGQDLVAGTQYIFKIPMVRNPLLQHTSLSYRISTIKINNIDQRVFTLEQYWFINHAYVDPVHTDMTSANFQMNSINNYVQQNTMDLSVKFNYNIAQPQRILLKWDNNNPNSINRLQLLTITISGCIVEVFPTIYLIMITPTSYFSNAWSVMSLGTNFISNYYVTAYGFWYVYICNNSLTQYYYNPANQWLKQLTDLNPKNFQYLVGYQTINSVCLYRLTINTPQTIPRGGYIQINLSNQLNSYENLCYTLTLFPLIDPTLPQNALYGALNCQKASSSSYIISGFDQYNQATQINVILFLKNANSGATVNIQSVAIYGTQNPVNIIATSQPVPQTVVYANNPGMLQYDIIDYVTYPIYAKAWQRFDFLFILRSHDLLINKNLQLKLTLPTGWQVASGSRIDIKGRYKVNDPQQFQYNTYPVPPTINKDWTASKYSSQPNKMVFDINVDTPLLSHYSIPKQIEYIFSIQTQRADTAFNEGLFNQDFGLYNFFLEAWDNTTPPGTLLERTYNEFYVHPQEDTADTFRATVLNTAAGEKTIIRFTFTMNYNQAQPGDLIWIEFQTFDRLYTVFKDDLGLGFSDPISSTIGCSENTGLNQISSNRIVCNIFKGNHAQDYPRGQPVVIKILVGKNIIQGEKIDFFIAYIENPLIVNQVVGIKLSIRRSCRDDYPAFHCIMYHAEHQYRTTNPIPLSSYLNAGTFTAVPNTVTLSASHFFTLTPTQNINPLQYILIQYPSNHINKNTCTTTEGMCIEFPQYNWVLFQTNAIINANVQSTIELDNMINGIFRRNPIPTNYFLLQVFSGNGIISQPFKITHNYYDYYMINTAGQVLNTQTYDPIRTTTSLFLKEGYLNIAQLDVINMDIESQIAYYRLEKPSQINQFTLNYCNATLTIVPPTLRNPYPLRFDCEVNPQYILLIRTQYFPTWTTPFATYNLRIYFEFIIDNQVPPQGIPPGPADPFLFYGCAYRCEDLGNPLNNLDYYHVTKSIIPWSISYYQQPDLKTAGFYTQSFNDRQASINDGDVSIYMLIKPNSNSCPITTLVFKISDDFVYPRALSLDSCTVQGKNTLQVTSCSLARRNGQTTVTLTLAQALGTLSQIITLADSNGNNLFTAPPYPGTYVYPVKLDMYCGQQLAETQQTNITNVRGAEINIAYLKIINSLDSLVNQLYDIEFQTGQYATPIGYNRQSSSSTISNNQGVYSQINIVFEWNGDGYTIHPGYAQDLGMNQQSGTEVGCAVKQGLIINNGNRLVCKIYNGSGAITMPYIQVTGYEQIPPNTIIGILITNVQSISAGLYTTVQVGIQVVNPQLNSTAYFYNLKAYVPDLTTPLNTIQTNSATIVVTGNNQVNSFSNYQFTLKTNSQAVQTTDYIGFAFPPNFINTINYDPSQISCANCGQIYVFPASSMIYIQPNAPINPLTTVTYNLNGIPNPNYAIQGNVNVQGFTFINRKIDGYYSTQFNANFVPSNKFTSAVVEASSQIGGDTGVTYTFSFVLGHIIPPNGSVSIDFPQALYNNPQQMAIPLDCSLQGDVFTQQNQSYCKFVSPTRLAVILVNTNLSPINSYIVILKGITNPNISYQNSQSSSKFIFSSQFSQNPVLNQIIAQTSARPPLYYVTSIKKCSMNVNPSITNIKLQSFYSFSFLCSSYIKYKTTVQIMLPNEYRVGNSLVDYTCSSFEPTTLYTSQCTLNDVQGQWVLTLILRNITQSQPFTINIQLNNPQIPNSAYPFSAQFYSYSSMYTQTDNSGSCYASIVQNNQLVDENQQDSSNQIKLQNVPINAALPAFYIFQTPNVNSIKNILSTQIIFPSQFQASLGVNLKCFIYQSDDANYQFSIENILQLKVNISSTSQALVNVPCSVVFDFTIEIAGVTSLFSSSQFAWNYILIQNVFNPGQFYLDNYQITHKSGSLALWVFYGPLYYKITDVPKQLDIKNIYPIKNSTSIYSPYVFQTEVIYWLKTNIRMGIIVDLPDQFDMSQQQTNINCFSSISQSLNVQCNLYNNTILAQKNLNTLDGILQMLYVDSLINPSSVNPCSDPQIQNPYFQISIADLSTNEILATQFSNKQFCMQYVDDLLYIKIIGPNDVIIGQSYNYQIQIQKPANILKLIPTYDNIQFELVPDIFLFQNYSLPAVLNFKLNVKSSAVVGPHTISLQKYEIRNGYYSQAGDEYQLPPIIKLNVNNNTSLQNPSFVNIMYFTQYSLGGVITAYITIPNPPAQNMYLEIDATNSTNVIVNPTKLLITPQTTQLNYTIKFNSSKILAPVPIYYSLVSDQPIYHMLNTNVTYLISTLSDSQQGFKVAKLELTNNLPDSSYYKNDIGQSINSTQYNNPKIAPQIFNITTANLTENSATLNIITSKSCTLQYMLLYKNSIIPTASQILSQVYSNGNIQGTGSGQSDKYFPEAIDYAAQITLNNLNFQTSYDISFVCYNGLGQSTVSRYQFTTSTLQSGAILHLTLTQNTDPNLLLQQLSEALRVNLKDLAIVTSSQILQNQGSRTQNTLFSYEIAIAPQTNGFDMYSYLQDIISSNQANFLSLMKSYVTGFQTYRVEPFARKYMNSMSQVQDMIPVIQSVQFYSLNVSVKAWDNSVVYGMVLLDNNQTVVTQQIILGLDQINNPIPQYWQNSALSSNSNSNIAYLYFDNLMDGTQYRLYLTATNYMPFQSPIYYRLPDTQYISLNFTTPFNYNLNRCQMLDEVRSFDPKLSSILESRFETDDDYGYCISQFLTNKTQQNN